MAEECCYGVETLPIRTWRDTQQQSLETLFLFGEEALPLFRDTPPPPLGNVDFFMANDEDPLAVLSSCD